VIDSHCHLDYCDDPLAVDPSLTAIISVGTTLVRCRATVALAERFANVWAVVGIHPNDAFEAQEAEVRTEIAALARHPKVVAIGESGFDDYWDRVDQATQRQSLRWQAELAAELDKPLILHVRDKQNGEQSSKAAAAMLRELGWHKGVLHCFNGHPELLEAGLTLGWSVSFAGNLTYPGAQALHAVAKALPADRLLVETDSPFMTPVPKRGQRNVPANVRYTAAFLAALRGETSEQIEAVTDRNATRLFGLPVAGGQALSRVLN